MKSPDSEDLSTFTEEVPLVTPQKPSPLYPHSVLFPTIGLSDPRWFPVSASPAVIVTPADMGTW